MHKKPGCTPREQRWSGLGLRGDQELNQHPEPLVGPAPRTVLLGDPHSVGLDEEAAGDVAITRAPQRKHDKLGVSPSNPPYRLKTIHHCTPAPTPPLNAGSQPAATPGAANTDWMLLGSQNDSF